MVLIHGWTATADVNFHHCYGPLSNDVRVVAFDQRGHGTGLRPKRPFRLADCADDVVRVADALGIDRVVPVGYSMGGAIAQLVAHRHPARVRGLVLAATAASFAEGRTGSARAVALGSMATVARVTPGAAKRRITDRLYLERKRGYWEPWAIEMAAEHDWRIVLEAGAALGTFHSERWLPSISAPTAVIVPRDDGVVEPARQRELARLIPHATTYTIAGNHLAAATSPETFVPALRAAVRDVCSR